MHEQVTSIGAGKLGLPDRRRHPEPVAGSGLDPRLKAVRAAGYIETLRRDLLEVAETAASSTRA